MLLYSRLNRLCQYIHAGGRFDNMEYKGNVGVHHNLFYTFKLHLFAEK
ncbi:hypothetical protein BTN50_1599 (plasmid) [Candidatus Enterovibrio altilux]|uniref:Uncharacterized protein n=1 Tax=Candidatus Enterovibrio altilux TaxID=1927128 RepID=A0A291BAL6_9GAMM|nr:hypothetical protein BTN50_1599 [Candidatus Enterovibrio luxaltus]